jgi:hypothetical protein
MSTRSLGTLTLDLIAKVGGFVEGMDKARRESSKRMKAIKADAVKLGRDIGIALAAGATAFSALIKSAINTADEMSKLAQSTGLSTEALSQLDYAAKLSGVNDLGGSLTKFNRTIAEAAQGTAAQADAFKALGIDVRSADGALKDSETLLLEVAEAFSQYEDGAAKTAVAMDLFGRSGANLIPLLNAGADGIAEMRKEADSFGLTLDAATGKAAEAFNDNLSRMGEMVRGVALRSAAELLPAMEGVSSVFVDTLKDTEAVDKAMAGLAMTFKTVVSAGIVVKNAFDIVGKSLGAMAAYVTTLVTQGFSAAQKLNQELYDDIASDFTDIFENINKVWSENMGKLPEPAEDAAEKVKKSLVLAATGMSEGTAKPMREAVDRVAEYIARLQEQADTLGMNAAELDAYKLAALGANDQQQELAASLNASIAAWDAQQAAVARAKQIYEETRTPLERLQQQIAEANEARLSGGLDDEAYTRFVEQAQDAFDQVRLSAELSAGGIRGAFAELGLDLEAMNRHFAGDTMLSMRNGIAGFFTDIATGGKSAGDALKDFARGFAQSMAQIASNALATFLVLKLLDAVYPGLGQATAAGMSVGGGRANGGPVESGTLYPVNERGPELLSVSGKDYLMMGSSAGMVTPNEKLGGSPNIRIVNAYDASHVLDYMGSASGEQVIVNAVRRNPAIIRQIAQGQLV